MNAEEKQAMRDTVELAGSKGPVRAVGRLQTTILRN